MQRRMTMSLVGVVVATVSLVVGVGTVLAQSGNPNIGSWKLSAAKSKFTPGTANTSGTIKIEAAGAGVKMTVDQVAADGTVRHYTYTANYDGKDTPVVGNSANGDSVALTRVDANTTRTINKKGGKVTVTQTSVVSADGKTRTVTSKGTNSQGQAVDNVAVYDRS